MNEQNMQIVFESGISDIVDCNSSFDKGVLRVAYTGRNRNNSSISRDAFERCVASMCYCPVVCRYDREEDVIGSHDIEVVSDDDGGMHIVNVTQPVGVIPGGEHFSYWWEEIEDDSGVHEYLCTNVLLWKRQEAYEKIKRDGIVAESMEITVQEGRMVDGVYVIDRFEFTAFCLLGTAQPCFESASLQLFSLEESLGDFKTRLAEMMQALEEMQGHQENYNASEAIVIDQENHLKGGDTLDEKKLLAEEYGFDIDALDFSVEDLAVDELREKFEEMKKENDFALEQDFHDELCLALESIKVETEYGARPRYWFWDYDHDAMEVYVTDATDFNLYGFPFSMDGDHVVIDFAQKKRMKVTVAPFDEGSQSNPMGNMFAKIAEEYESELDDLRKFKADTEAALSQEARDAVFAKFADLCDVEEFIELQSNCAEYSIESLEEKCFAIRGRNIQPLTFSSEHPTPSAPRVPVEKTIPASEEPYGGIFEKYGY